MFRQLCENFWFEYYPLYGTIRQWLPSTSINTSLQYTENVDENGNILQYADLRTIA